MTKGEGLKLVLFDLDETLYPRSATLMDQISARITQYLIEKAGVPAENATALRTRFRGTYGTALRGLMEEGYTIDIDDYFQYVHDIELNGRIDADPKLRAMLLDLPLRRAVLTNSNIEHAERILRHMDIFDCFEMVIDIRALGYMNKPAREAYDKAMAMLGVQPAEVIFVEDTPMNTRPAREMGMITVLIDCPLSDDADYFLDNVMEIGPLVGSLVGRADRL
jgi:putative hydrolase of the HAD superfamily